MKRSNKEQFFSTGVFKPLTGTTIDHHGYRRQKNIDLAFPDFRRLIADPRIPLKKYGPEGEIEPPIKGLHWNISIFVIVKAQRG